MEFLIPELQDIVKSYCSPYHEICSQERDTKNKLKSMGIDYKVPIYNTPFLETLIESNNYTELLHDCFLANDMTLYSVIEKTALPQGIPLRGRFGAPDEKYFARYKTFRETLWDAVVDNQLCEFVYLLKKYSLEPLHPTRYSIDMLKAFADQYPRKDRYLQAFIQKKFLEDAKEYLITSTTIPQEDIADLSDKQCLEHLQALNQLTKKKRKVMG